MCLYALLDYLSHEGCILNASDIKGNEAPKRIHLSDMVWLKHNTTRSSDDVGTQRQPGGLRFRHIFKIRRSKPKPTHEGLKFPSQLEDKSGEVSEDGASFNQGSSGSNPGPLVVRVQRPSSHIRVKAKEIQERLHGPHLHADSGSSNTDTTDTSTQSKLESDGSFTMVEEVPSQAGAESLGKSQLATKIFEVFDSQESIGDSTSCSTLADETTGGQVPHTIQAISEPQTSSKASVKRKSITTAPAPKIASFHSRTFTKSTEKCGPRLEPVTPLVPAISGKSLPSNNSVRSVAFEAKQPPTSTQPANYSFNVPARNPLRGGVGAGGGIGAPGGRYKQRQSLLGEECRSTYGNSTCAPHYGVNIPGNEFTLRNRAGNRVTHQPKNRVSSVLPQHYRAKPLSKKNPISMASDVEGLVFTDPHAIQPSTSNGSGSGRSGNSGKSSQTTRSSRKRWDMRERSSASPVSVQGYPQYTVYPPSMEKLNKPGTRASVASSLASILPYIVQYNRTIAEENDEPVAPRIDVGSIADTYCRTEHIEDTEAKRLEEQNRQIERLLFDREPVVSDSSLDGTGKDIVCAPCQDSIEEYANKLEQQFSHIREVKANPEFSERILRGTSYAALERRSRLLDKDLPHLPDHVQDILGKKSARGKGIDMILGKLRILN